MIERKQFIVFFDSETFFKNDRVCSSAHKMVGTFCSCLTTYFAEISPVRQIADHSFLSVYQYRICTKRTCLSLSSIENHNRPVFLARPNMV